MCPNCLSWSNLSNAHVCLHTICSRKMISSDQPKCILDQSTDTDVNQLGMTTECRTSEAWIWGAFLFIPCYSLFAALIIQTAQHRLIDIQESPLIIAEQEFNYDGNLQIVTLRRHSFQDIRNDVRADFFERQFAQHIHNNSGLDDSDWDEKTLQCNNNRRCHANALNWLKHFNIIRDKCQYDKIPQQRRFKMDLRKTSSENELLLMTPSNDPSVDDIPAMRRSFSSGLLF